MEDESFPLLDNLVNVLHLEGYYLKAINAVSHLSLIEIQYNFVTMNFTTSLKREAESC